MGRNMTDLTPGCDHTCESGHRPIGPVKIVGGMLTPEQAYKEMSPEARKIVDEMRESTVKMKEELWEAAKKRRDE